MPAITVRSQGCTTSWEYMKSGNGSRICFDGPNDKSKTCLCSDSDFCNRQLPSIGDYRRLGLEAFPPIPTRKIDCFNSRVLFSGQAYCTYRRTIGVDEIWLKRAHATGYVSLLENSQRDHLCFQDEKKIDCYCKTDRCNENVPPPSFVKPPFFIGFYDDKVSLPDF